jgi:hypothetical protein
VHRLALVELEVTLAVVVLDDPGVLLGGVDLLEHPPVVGSLDEAGGKDREDDEQHRRGGRPGPADAQRGRDREDDREEQEGPLRPGHGDEHEGGEEGPHERSDRRDGVHATRGLPGVLDALELEADGPWRDRTEHQHGQGDQREHPEERARERPDGDRVKRLDAEPRAAGRRRTGRSEQDRGDHDQEAEPAMCGMAVREPAAEPVADREGHEDDRDRVRPDDRRGAEERGHEAGGGDLGAERRHADDEDEQAQRRAGAGTVGGGGRLGTRRSGGRGGHRPPVCNSGQAASGQLVRQRLAQAFALDADGAHHE